VSRTLPPLPVDDVSLDLYWSALHPGPDAERSSIGDVLDLLSEMAGSDPDAVEERLAENVVVMRDPMYHPNSLISALITEIRRLRSAEV
jgi:hypothetical protein